MGYAWFNLVVTIVAIVYGVYYQFYLLPYQEEQEKLVKDKDDGDPKIQLFTIDELSQYDGSGENKLYLSIMGEVFDVERGRQHYGPGGSYATFAGKDASRAFITGEFDDKKSNLDHVLSLSPVELVSLKKWRDFYAENYDFVGRLIGRFFDETGEPTEYFWSIDKKIQFGLKQQEEEKDLNQEFPPCNVEYRAETGTSVWCTKQSGGIDRDWAGYPIQYFNQETKTFSCVCVQKERFNLPQLRQYENCDESTRRCSIPKNEDVADDE